MFCLSNVHVLPVKRVRIERKTMRKKVCAERLLANGNKERLISLDLLPISYWHEFLDLMFFFKAISEFVLVSSDVLPEQVDLSRVTRSSADTSVMTFRPRQCIRHQRTNDRSL